MLQTSQSQAMIRTSIPFRLDRLPWSRFHLLVVIGLGITWILDGLEVTIVGSLGPALQSTETLHLSSANLGAVASFYVVGAVVGALVFGWITDRYGRRLVFYVTLIVYLSGVLLSAFAWDFWSFAIFRMITGLGIGGEYVENTAAAAELAGQLDRFHPLEAVFHEPRHAVRERPRLAAARAGDDQHRTGVDAAVGARGRHRLELLVIQFRAIINVKIPRAGRGSTWGTRRASNCRATPHDGFSESRSSGAF